MCNGAIKNSVRIPKKKYKSTVTFLFTSKEIILDIRTKVQNSVKKLK